MYKSDITEEQALACFNSGIDCSQVVFGEMAEQLGIDKKTAQDIAAVFGGGMMHGSVCGCVSGAYMAIGLRYGQSGGSAAQRKELMMKKKAEFEQAFCAEFGSINCCDILGHKIPEDMPEILAAKLFETTCAPAAVLACNILADMFNS